MNTCILLDNSGSMIESVGDRRRIDVLQDILNRTPWPAGARLFSFASSVTELDGTKLPAPGGGTALHTALTHIAPLRPAIVAIVSDGQPNDPQAALDAARALNCEIRTYFCGDPTNTAAVALLRALAWASSDGLGRFLTTDLRNPTKLIGELRLLSGPSK
jgi:hypothetical protein